MDLILWRHAEAEYGEPDLGRALTSKGEKQARRMADWLHHHLPDSARILISPATRAQQTARALLELGQRKHKTVESLAPGASAEAVLAAADWPDAKVPIVVVGHQPTLGDVVSRLITDDSSEVPLKKGAIWWLQSRQRDGAPQIVVRAVVSPDLV